MKLEHWFFARPISNNRMVVNVRDPADSGLVCMGTLYGDPIIPDGAHIKTAEIELFTSNGIYTKDDLLYDLGAPCPAFAEDHPETMETLKAYQEELRKQGN